MIRNEQGCNLSHWYNRTLVFRATQKGSLTMERGIFILILIVGGIWLVLDQMYGQKRIEGFVRGLTAS